jgi:hypothetical protein
VTVDQCDTKLIPAKVSTSLGTVSSIFRVNGGAVPKSKALRTKPGKSVSSNKEAPTSLLSYMQPIKDTLMQVQPVSRTYLVLSLVCAAVHAAGLPAPAWFSLDPARVAGRLEMWRPLSAAVYLGAPSMSMANSVFFLMRYGQTFESQYGESLSNNASVHLPLNVLVNFSCQMPFFFCCTMPA